MKNQAVSRRTILKLVGKKFYMLRTGRNLEINSVAASLKISGQTILRIENGETDIRLDLLNKICYYYNIQPKAFVEDLENGLKT